MCLAFIAHNNETNLNYKESLIFDIVNWSFNESLLGADDDGGNRANIPAPRMYDLDCVLFPW